MPPIVDVIYHRQLTRQVIENREGVCGFGHNQCLVVLCHKKETY